MTVPLQEKNWWRKASRLPPGAGPLQTATLWPTKRVVRHAKKSSKRLEDALAVCGRAADTTEAMTHLDEEREVVSFGFLGANPHQGA
jgi:hypothetical protein